jgi:hypothetical protein
MTALDLIFTSLAVLGFLATMWVCGIVAWRLLKAPKR